MSSLHTNPVHNNCFSNLYQLITLQIFILDCRTEKWANSFVLTFLMAIFWISIYSYMMVWMITIVGSTFMIPDTVMGLTFIAAGVSVPDALAGIAVVREGNIDYQDIYLDKFLFF